uniref:Secreted protein n=1 Tax=Hymenolepis diminuta TaxID=6216 RepID=A0A0R3SMQ5_HYMDI
LISLHLSGNRLTLWLSLSLSLSSSFVLPKNLGEMLIMIWRLPSVWLVVEAFPEVVCHIFYRILSIPSCPSTTILSRVYHLHLEILMRFENPPRNDSSIIWTRLRITLD